MLKGNNINLRPLELNDIPLIVEWKNDREISNLTGSYTPTTELKEEAMFQVEQESNNTYRFIIEDEEEYIGYCGITGINWHSRRAELFIRIAEKDKWKKGIGKEATNLLIKFAFNDLNLNKIFLTCFTDNTNALNLYKKFNFITEGTLRQHHFCNGKYKDMEIMSLLKEEWN